MPKPALRRAPPPARAIAALLPLLAGPFPAGAGEVPDDFCAGVQASLAGTLLRADNERYTDLAAFKSSKPAVDPLTTRQFVHRDGSGRAVMISCKTKTADHILAVHGPGTAGPQRSCGDETRRIVGGVAQALAERGDRAGAAAARAVVVEPDEPSITGTSWLEAFPLAYRGADGQLHVATRSLLIRWEDWRFWIFPDRLRGTHYCHLIAPGYLERLVTGLVPVPAPPAD